MKYLRLYITSFLLAFTMGSLYASTSVSSLDEREDNGVKIQIERTEARILNAAQSTLEIYDLTGKRIATHRIDNADKIISLPAQRGCYILKIGKLTRKVSVH